MKESLGILYEKYFLNKTASWKIILHLTYKIQVKFYLFGNILYSKNKQKNRYEGLPVECILDT